MAEINVPTRARIRARIETPGVDLAGRVFSDPDAKLLEYHLIPHSPFQTYIDVGPVRFDCDAQGFPVMVRCDLSSVVPHRQILHRPPLQAEPGTVRLLDGPSRIDVPGFRVTTDGLNTHIQFAMAKGQRRVRMAPGAIWEVDSEGCLTGLWLLDPCLDPYGRWRPAWRLAQWRKSRRQRRHLAVPASPFRLSPISVGTTS